MRILILFIFVLFLLGCTPENAISTEQFVSNKESYLNQEVQIKVTPQVNKKLCTMQFCSGEEPCCNSCSAQLSINYNEETIPIIGTNCEGNNCELNCEPIKQNQEQIIKGTLTEEGFELNNE